MDLCGVPRVVHGCFASDELGDGSFLLERFAGQHLRGCFVVGGTGCRNTGFHAGDLEGNRLVAGNRLAEAGALLRVLHGRVNTALRGTDRQCGNRDTTLIENAQEVCVAATALTQQVLFGNLDVVEGQRVGVR